MPLWTKRDRFVPVAATAAGRPEIGLERELIAELWNDCGNLVRVAAARCKRPRHVANGRGRSRRAARWGVAA